MREGEKAVMGILSRLLFLKIIRRGCQGSSRNSRWLRDFEEGAWYFPYNIIVSDAIDYRDGFDRIVVKEKL